MANENATMEKKDNLDGLDLDELERLLQDDLEEKLGDLEFIDEQQEQIGSPDALGEVLLNTVWEQFTNQIAIQAGEDFVKANNGLKLDLRDEAHIQTTENFAEGKIATHNTEIDYQQRYDDWQNNFQKNEDGSIKTKKDNRTGEEKAVLRQKNTKKDPNGENYNTNYDAREFIDKDRPQGSKTVHKDHTVPAAEIIRDPEAAAHMTREEQAAFANSDVNLVDLDSRANESKGDSKMTDWLDSERNGEKPADRFPIDEDELRKRDEEARAEYEKQKKEAEQRSVEAGKKSQKEEAFRVGKKAVRAIVMNLLADLVKNILRKFVLWLKSAEKNIKSLLTALSSAISEFITNLKNNVLNVGQTAVTVIASSIWGPIVNTITRAWMFIKQGWKSLKEAVDYIRNPENKSKPVSIMIMEVGKIVTAGMTAAGAIVLGEVIEAGLSTIPILAVEIPLFGSLANIIGIFLGAVISGIIGALAINLINSLIAKKQKEELIRDQVDKGNEVLATQEAIISVKKQKMDLAKAEAASDIKQRHEAASDMMRKSLDHIIHNNGESNDEEFSEINRRLDDITEQSEEES